MPDKQLDVLQAFFYLVAAVSGMVGGCAAAAQQVLRRRALGALPLLAYAVIGLFFGLAFFAFLNLRGFVEPSLETAVLYAGGAGLFSAFALASINVGSRLVLRWRGLEIDMSFRRAKKADEDAS